MHDTMILRGTLCLCIFGNLYAHGKIPSVTNNLLYVCSSIYSLFFHSKEVERMLRAPNVNLLIGFLLINSCPSPTTSSLSSNCNHFYQEQS